MSELWESVLCLPTLTAAPEGSRGERVWSFSLKLRVFTVDDRRSSPRQLDLSSARMSLRYRDKVVIVTGGSKGIGRGVVRAFGRKHDVKCA